MARYSAVLKGGAPWGFRLQGGRDTDAPLTIAKVNPNSKAAKAHIRIGDVVEIINSTPAYHLDNKDAINLVHSTYGDLELVLCRQTGLMNGSTDNMSTTSTTKTTIIKPDPSASTDNDKIELDGVTLQGFAPSNVSVVKTTTTKITKITRSRSPSPSPMNQPILTQGTISFVGGETEPVRQSGDGMPTPQSGAVCFTPPSLAGIPPPRYQDIRRGRNPTPNQKSSDPAAKNQPIHVVNGHSGPNGTAPSQADTGPNSHRSSVVIPRLSGNQPQSSSISWKPVNFNPGARDQTSRTATFSPPPPVPPSPTESLDVPPAVPPKPKVTKTNITLSANQPQEEIEEPPPPRILDSGQYPPPVSRQPKPSYSTNNNEESWPAPPPLVTQPVMHRQEAPIVHHPAPSLTDAQSQSAPPVWSPSQPSQSSQDLEPNQDGGSIKDVPPVWTPTGSSNKPKEYKPVKLDLNRQPRPSVEGASDSGSTRSNDDAATSPSYTWNPPPTRTSSGNAPSQPSEVYRPTNVTEQYRPPPPPPPSATEQYKSTNAPQQYAPPVPVTDRPVTESRPSNSQDQYPQPPDVPEESDGRPRTASDPVMHNSGDTEEKKPDFRQVPNGHVVNLPRSVSPTVTLLQYQRDDDLKDQIRHQLRHPNADVTLESSELPEGAVYQTQTVDGDVVHTDTYYPVKQVTTKKERRVVEAPTYEGIGPRDKSGLPLGLRQHVKETNRHDWYKEMFKSIHKRDEEEDEDNKYMRMLKDEEEVVSAKQQETQSSAPPPTDQKDDIKTGSPLPKEPKGEVDARWDPQRYQAQPRSIENYRPGASSLAAKDRTPTSDMYNPPPEPITAAQFGRRTIEPLKREIRRQVNAAPHRTADDSQLLKSPKEPPIGQSKPHAATLPRLPKPRSSESSGLSAAERLGIKSPPPQRNPPTTQNASQKERERVLSGGDRLYNYRNPPSTIDKATAEKLIEEERQKRKLVDRDNQQLRRHSDFNPVKSPIITNDRFNDLLGEPPKPAEKPLPKWKQEEAAKKTEPTSPKPEVKACVLALYPFKAQTAKELSFSKGDTIYLRRDIDKNWYEGEHHGSVGIFPKAYVEVVTSIEEARQAMLSSPSTEGKARAKYKFKGETQMELSFNKGDIIDLNRRIDNNWWDAKLGSRKGIVPASYVDVIREPSAVSSPASRSPLNSPPMNSTPTHNRVASQESYQYPSLMGSPSIAASGRPATGPKSSWDKDSYSIQPERIQPKSQQVTQSAAPVHVVDARGLMQQLQDKYRAIYPYMPMNDDELELEEGDIVLVMEKCDDGWYVGTSTRTHMFGTFPGNYVEKI